MSLEESVDFLVNGSGNVSINDEVHIVDLRFGDEDNPKIFCQVDNEEYVMVFVLENIYEGVKVGDSITDFAQENMLNDLFEGKIRPYISFSFPKSDIGSKAIGSLIRNLEVTQEFLKEWSDSE